MARKTAKKEGKRKGWGWCSPKMAFFSGCNPRRMVFFGERKGVGEI